MTDERLAARFPPCDYVYSRGLKRGLMCESPGNYGGRCCKHKVKDKSQPGNSMDQLKQLSAEEKKAENTDKLKEDPIFNDKVQDAKPTSRSSVWTFTINTNTNYDNMNDDDKKRFKRFMSYVFDKEGIFDFVTDQESYDDPKKNIEEVEIDYFFENSSKNLLHTHGFIKIIHHGYLKLRYGDIKEFAKIIFGKNLHMDFQAGTDAVTGWKNYMAKQGVAGKITL